MATDDHKKSGARFTTTICILLVVFSTGTLLGFAVCAPEEGFKSVVGGFVCIFSLIGLFFTALVALIKLSEKLYGRP